MMRRIPTQDNHTGNNEEIRSGEQVSIEQENMEGREIMVEGGDENGNREDSTDTEEDTRWRTHWGHLGDERIDNTIRIQSININTFPKRGSPKINILRKQMEKAEITGMSELNKNHYKTNWMTGVVANTTRWAEKGKTNLDWLRDRDWEYEHQQGGVSLTTQGSMMEYRMEEGGDVSGLGRWTWVKFEGQDSRRTVIIQVYRPVKNTKDIGSTYRQQASKLDTEPLQTYDTDLVELIEIFTKDKWQVIVMGDFNTDMEKHHSLPAKLRKAGLRDILREKHGRGTPSHRKGSKVIDGIWATANIEMTQGGVQGGDRLLSDHRVIWAEITLDSLLGKNRGEKESPHRRRMKTTNTKALQRYNSILQKQIKVHKLVKKSAKLWQEVKHTRKMTEEQKHRFATIDEQRIRAMTTAERRSRKYRQHSLEFSPALQEAFCKIEVYRYIYERQKNRKRPNISTIKTIKRKWGILTIYHVPEQLEETKKELEQAYTTFYKVQKEAPTLREEFMAKQLREAEEKGETEKAKQLQHIMEKERLKSTHQRIKGARGMLERKGVRFVEKINQDGNKTIVKDKMMMEIEIAESNIKRISQSNNTETRQGTLGDLITDSDYDRWEEIIQGKHTLPEEMSEGTTKWMEFLQSTQNPNRDIEITVEEYTRTWNRVKEETSCAPSALNYSTMKAIKWNKIAAELHTHMANITIRTGIYPRRWEECVNSMLPKKKDQWHPDKLRLISLLMADFNHNNKIIGRIAMRWAEEEGLLAAEQYGSRRNLSAELHALNKRLLLDILRIQRRPGVIIANDAKSCYDRILHFAAYASLRRAGVRKETIISMLEPIRRMTHRIRTAYGDSFMSYGGEDWERDPHGILQGNGAGPAIWALVSSPLLEILRNAGFGASLYSAIGREFFNMCGFAFVDDADIVQTGLLFQRPEEVMRKAQTELKLWEELIKATGGALVPSKSDFSVISFGWDKEGRWKHEKQNSRRKLKVRDHQGKMEELENPPTTKARRTLGVWQAIDGNEKGQVKHLKKKAGQWIEKIQNSNLSKLEVHIGVTSSLYPAITYGLGATAMSAKECNKVDSAIRKILPKMGYCRSVPKDIIFGHKDHGGAGLQSIHTIQGVKHIKMILNEAGTGSPTDKLFQILMEGHLLEVGHQGKLWQIDYTKVKDLLTDTWIKNTMEFKHKQGINIVGQERQLNYWRQEDSMIMEDILNTPGTTYSQEERGAINRCRMFLQCTTKSDIAESDGKVIRDSVWEHCRGRFSVVV